jgi:hypothetical protein
MSHGSMRHLLRKLIIFTEHLDGRQGRHWDWSHRPMSLPYT